MGTSQGILGISLFAALVAVACGSTDDGGDDGHVTTGTAQLGEECRSNTDCAPLEGSEVRCTCTDEADVPVCARLSALGESCSDGGSFQLGCVSGASCMGQTSLDDAICVAQAAEGETCSGNGGCTPDLFCDGGTCVRGSAAVGEDCFDDGECGAAYRCDFPFGCAPRLTAGASCSDAGVPTARTCVDGYACAGETERCELLKSDGAECFWDEECNANECFFGTCGHGARMEGIVKCGF
jgi:hypothetical protein